jgi:hypothetical protein
MVRDAHDALNDASVPAPLMLRRPTEMPAPLGSASATEGVSTFRRLWADKNHGGTRSMRAWAGRVSGRSDRRLLLAVAGATEAMAAHCDLLVERLTAQEAVTADVASSFGHEIVQLRAEVDRLQRSVDALRSNES